MDFVLKAELKSYGIKITGAFQSLFYWILFLRLFYQEKIKRTRRVSILVLLDFVLKVVEQAYKEMDGGGFNPCFIGFCS